MFILNKFCLHVSHEKIFYSVNFYIWLSGQLWSWLRTISCLCNRRTGSAHPFLSMNKAYHIVEKITYLKLILSEGTLGKWILWAPVSTSSMSFLALRAMDTALGAGQALELPSEYVSGFFRCLPSVLFKFKRWEEKITQGKKIL